MWCFVSRNVATVISDYSPLDNIRAFVFYTIFFAPILSLKNFLMGKLFAGGRPCEISGGSCQKGKQSRQFLRLLWSDESVLRIWYLDEVGDAIDIVCVNIAWAGTQGKH